MFLSLVFRFLLFFHSVEHKTEEYSQINPMKKVPAIVDGNFKLTER